MSGETQINVNCPAWLRRRMLHNIQKAAKDKVNRARAEVAANLFAAIKKKPDVTSSRAEVDSTTGKTGSDGVKAAEQFVQSTNQGLWRHPKAVSYKAVSRISQYVGHNRHTVTVSNFVRGLLHDEPSRGQLSETSATYDRT